MKHSETDVCQMHAIVRGRVQGVGFRALTRYYANSLELTGTVRNLFDGRVEIYAYGSKKRLEELIEKLRKEFSPEQIEEVAVDYLPIEALPQDFRIIH